MTPVLPYLKSIVGALIAALGALGTALTDDVVTNAEWVAVALAGLVVLAAVFGVPNRDPQALHQDESVMPSERGATDLALVLAVAALIVGVLALAGYRI